MRSDQRRAGAQGSANGHARSWRATRHCERARADAEQANRAKSAFLATMSHEIRTPMNGVIGMAEVLARQQNRAEQATTQSRRCETPRLSLLRIIDDILDFSKIEAGRLELERAPVATCPTWSKTSADSLVPVAAAKGVRLHVFIAPAGSGDGVRRRDPATPGALQPGGQRDQVQRRPVASCKAGCRYGSNVADADRCVWPSVSADNGIGMTPRDPGQRCSRPSRQAEASTTRRFGGTGLGLAISQAAGAN